MSEVDALFASICAIALTDRLRRTATTIAWYRRPDSGLDEAEEHSWDR
jgi:hypothetical protein